MKSVSSRVRGGSLLDLGVGTGRTTSLLLLLGDDYLGLDYSEPMVKTCRIRYPGTQFAHGDARKLDGLPNDHFSLVLFSYNGIDYVSPAERIEVMSEIQRVLRPGGVFVYSSHNLYGPGRKAKPWSVPLVQGSFFQSCVALVKWPRSLLGSSRAYLRNRTLESDEGDFGMFRDAALGFSLVTHYGSVGSNSRQLREAGLEIESAWTGPQGTRVPLDGEDVSSPWIHFVAVKPA